MTSTFTPSASQFNLFRINCLVADKALSLYKRVVLALTVELIYERDNEYVDLKELYRLLLESFQLTLPFEEFENIVNASKLFEQQLADETIVRIEPKEVEAIRRRINEKSLAHYIEAFISKRSLTESQGRQLEQLVYESIYMNIMTFDTKNIRSLLHPLATQRYDHEETEMFNDFLEHKDHEKNNALYQVMLLAVEFAIVTSGKAVQEISKTISKGKVYVLDANVIFRLMGVGGEERQQGLQSLLKECHNQGVEFAITKWTDQELKGTIQEKIKDIKRVEQSRGSAKMLGELVTLKAFRIAADFVTHYGMLAKTKACKSVEDYNLRLLADYEKVKRTLAIKPDYKTPIKQELIDREATRLYDEKYRLFPHTHYTKAASQTDAANIIYVNVKRGFNNYNLPDVKCFYLTTDGSLNAVLNAESRKEVVETLLPSQLFILHNGLSHQHTGAVDYELFVSFLKRRSSNVQLSGQDALTYIEEIRQHTQSTEDAKDVIVAFLDRRAQESRRPGADEGSLKTLREVTKSILEGQIDYLSKKAEKLDIINEVGTQTIYTRRKAAKTIVWGVEVLVLALFASISKLIGTEVFVSLLLAILLIEVAKHFFSSRFPVLRLLERRIFYFLLKRSAYYKTTADRGFLLTEYDLPKG